MDKARILVVDDEANLRQAVKTWLSMRGFDVAEAGTGEEAVRLCTEAEFDVVTMDLQMPGMQGDEAIAHIKEIRPETRILVLTGYAQRTGSALANGAELILTKPIRMRDLEEHVRRLLDN